MTGFLCRGEINVSGLQMDSNFWERSKKLESKRERNCFLYSFLFL